MKQFYLLVAGLSLVFFWFAPKENNDSTTALSYSKKHEPTPKKLNIRVRNKNSKEPDILAISLNQNWQSPLAANVTVLKSVAVQGGGNAILGGQLNYTIEVSNTASGVANNATGVTVNDILNANLTLVSGSLKATPIIIEDSYDCIGNVGITVPANAGLLANDIDPLNLTIQATVINQAGTQGTVVANPDGSFTFTPNVGYTGTTTFTYTASNGNFARTATVSVVVSAPIWFVNVAAAANGNGTLASPFKDWSNFATANALTGTSDPAANQTIFVYSGTYSGAATLKAGQKVLGRGATVGLASFAGATVQTYTNALPSTSGTRPNLTSSGTTITLASDNTLRGFDMGNSTKDIVASSFGTLTTSEMALTGNGAALDLSTGTLDASFTNISSTNAASDAISLSSILGNLTNSGSTTITNPTGRGISIFSNSSLVSSFGNTTINGSAQTGLSITSSNSSISTTFGSLDVAPDAGQSSIQLSSNAGIVICTSGTLTSSNATLTVGISGANSSNKINLNMTLTAISASGGQKGISIKDATGSFTVTGVGTVIGSGGSLSNLTQKGVELDNASNITLRNMAFNNVSTTDETLSASDFSVSNGGIVAKDVSSLTLNNLSIAGSSQRGIAGHNVSNFSMTGCTIFSSGDNINEGAIAFTNLSGTCSISGSSITRANEHLISIQNTSVNLNITISNSTISDTQTNPSGTASLIVGTGILANTFGNGKTYVTVSNCTLNKIGADGIKLINNNSSLGSYEITGCSIDPVNTVTQPNDVGTALEITSNETSTVYANIHDNTRFSANGGNVVTIAPTENSTIHAKVINNIVTYKSGGISGVFRGIEIFGQDDAKGYVTITGNNVSGLPESNGIMVDNRTIAGNAGTGRIDANISNNTVTLNYPNTAIAFGRCILIEAGNSTTALPANTICARVASNTTTTNGINGNFRVSSYAPGSILLEGSSDAATAWNLNGNTPNTGSGGVVSVRSGSTVTMVAANTCVTPSNPPAFVALLANNEQFAESKDENNRLTFDDGKIKEISVPSEAFSLVDSKPTVESPQEFESEETQNSLADINSGETITVNGAGSGFLLPAGKSTTIIFSATISNTPSTCTIPNTASVSGNNFSTINSSTSTNIVIPPPTSVTTSAGICNGQSISLSATCASGIVQWYNLATPSTLLGTSNSGESFSQSPTTNTTYQATCKVNGCESARTNSGLITVNPLPSISVGVSSSICAGATSFIIPYSSASNSPNTYSISGTGITTVTEGALLANTIIVNLSSPATGSTYSYSLTVKNANGCVSSNTTGSVEVNAVPTINIESSTPICAGSNSFTIPYTSTSGSPTTYSISGTGITTVTNGALTSSPIIVNLSAGASGSSISYILTVTNAGGCASNDISSSVSVIDLPTLTQNSSTAICQGATSFTIPYTATTGTPTSYSIFGTGISTVTDGVLSDTPIIVDLSSGASGSSISYTLIVKNANGCTSSDITGNVTINALPIPNASSDSPKCVGTTLNFNSETGMSSYAWTGPNSFSSSIQNPNITDVTPDAAGIYSLTVTDANSCTSSETLVVTINPLPTPNASSDSPKCVGSTLSFNSETGMSSYGWTGPNSFSSSIQNPSITDVTTDAEGIYSLTVTDANGCTSSETVVVTINPLPVPNVSSDSPKCVGTTLSFNSEAGLTSYDWTGPNSFSSSIQNPSITDVTTDAAGIYSLTVTDANGCTSSETVVVTINSLPVPNASSDSPKCVGATLSFNSEAGLTTYDWTGPNSFSSSIQNPNITDVTTDASGIYSLTVTDANGCTSSETLVVTINPLPIPNSSSDSPKCVGSTLSFNSETGMSSYAWTGPNSFSSSIQNPSITDVTTDAAGIYSLTVTDANGCTSSETISVIINTLPTPNASSDSPKCVGTTLSFNSQTSMSSYAWTGPNSFSSSIQNPSIADVTSDAAGIYSLTVTDANGCTSSENIAVTFNSLPSANPSSDSPKCVGTTLSFNSEVGLSSYDWTGPNSFSSSIQNPSITNVITDAGGTYSLTVTDSNGCTTTAEIVVVVNDIPNTPITATQNVCYGSNLTLGASCVSGSHTIWATDTPGVYVNSLTVNNVTTDMTYQVACERDAMTGCFSSFVSAFVKVNTAISYTPISSENSYVYACQNGIGWIILNSSVVGNPLNIQWQLDTGTGFANIMSSTTYEGITNDSLKINNVSTTMNGYRYRAVVSNECNTIVTDTSTLRVNQLPIIDIQPLGQTVCVGNQTTLSVVANGSGLSYQWQLNSGSGFVNIATNASYTGVNSPNLQISNIQSGFNGYQYRCVIFNECQSVNSDPAAIIVDPTVTILSQPFDKNICQNASTSFNILAVNTLGGTISYQWQRKSGTVWVNLSNGGVYAGVNTSAFSINGAPANLSGSSYRCVMNGYCQSQSVTLSVIPIATISLQPSNVNICVGNNTSFSVNALGINLAYRWQVNTGTGFVNILDGGIYQGVTTQSLLLDQPKAILNGFLYRCIVTGNGSCDVIPAVSNSAILNIGTSAEAQTIVAVSPINSGSVVYQAVQVVLGLNSIVSPARVEYRAGNSILLNPGFEVNTGAVFTAKIQNPCSNPTNFQVNSNNLPKEIKK